MILGEKAGDKPSESEALRQRSILGQAAMMGTNVAAGMILFVLLGYYLDLKKGTGHFWTLIGVFMGFVYTVYEFWTTIRMLNTQAKQTTGGMGKSAAPKNCQPPGDSTDK